MTKLTTKEKLEKAALKLFAKNGFDKTSTASIAKEAGFSSATLFLYFSTKKELFKHLLISIETEFYQQVPAEALEKKNPLEQMALHMLYGGKFYLKNYNKFLFVKMFINSVYVSEMDVNQQRAGTKDILQKIEQAKKEKYLENYDVDYMFKLVTGAFFRQIEYFHNHKKDLKLKDVYIILKMIQK